MEVVGKDRSWVEYNGNRMGGGAPGAERVEGATAVKEGEDDGGGGIDDVG